MDKELMIAVGPGEVALTDRRTRHTWKVELAPYLLAVVPIRSFSTRKSRVNAPALRVGTTSRSSASHG